MMRKAVSLIALVALTACSMEPAYVRPAPPVPLSWPVGDAYLKQSEAGLPALTFKQVFRDPRLQQLIAEALVNNRDLRVAAANIASARAQYHIQRAQIFPEIDATAGATISHGAGSVSSTGSGSTGSSNNSGGTTTTSRSSSTNTYFTADVGTTAFEIDLFGRLRSESHAALDQYFATEAAARATRLTLVGNIADAWLTYASDKSLLDIAQDTVSSAQKSVQLTQERLNGGIAPRTDLRQAQQILTTAQADLARQTTALAQDVNLLRLLVGADIDPATLPTSIGSAVATLGEVPAGLDSSILLRRPDVVQAEYKLRAQNAQIGAARAALFPRISLTGLVGLASNALTGLFSGGGFNWSVRPSVSYPIFQAGAGVANVEQAKADRDAAVATYEKSIQTAFREVADALAQRGTITDQEDAVSRQVAAAEDNYNLTNARYRGGIDTYLSSLDAQRSLYTAQRTLVQTQLTRGTNLVALYQALGGDSLLDATANGPVPQSDQAGN